MNKNYTNGFWIALISISLIGMLYNYNGGFTGNVITGGSSFNLSLDTLRDITLNDSLNTSDIIKVRSLQEKGRIINASYSFDPSKFIGDEMSVDIWITNDNRTEIKRYRDSFSMRHDGVIPRRVVIDLRNYPAGIYYIHFAMSSNTANFIKQSFVLGETYTTGNTILENSKNKMITYGIFLLIIGIGIFFIFKNRSSDSDTYNSSEKQKKNSK